MSKLSVETEATLWENNLGERVLSVGRHPSGLDMIRLTFYPFCCSRANSKDDKVWADITEDQARLLILMLQNRLKESDPA